MTAARMRARRHPAAALLCCVLAAGLSGASQAARLPAAPLAPVAADEDAFGAWWTDASRLALYIELHRAYRSEARAAAPPPVLADASAAAPVKRPARRTAFRARKPPLR